eukprot:5085745-Prymnesium_polylepis.1
MLFDAGPLGPMHAHSGTAERMCLDRTPSIGTRVLSSVSAFRGCSFALGVQHVCAVHPYLRAVEYYQWTWRR